MSGKDSITQAWRYYENGRTYNNSLSPSQYATVNTNIEFFIGNQWRNLPKTRAMACLPKPVFNIIKRITSLFVASLTASGVAIVYDPLQYYDGTNLSDPSTDASEYATAEVRNLLDKFKMEYRIREALFDGAQTGDYCAHFYWDPDAVPYGGAFGPYRGEIQMELVDGINVMFGNPNTPNVEKQPYILIVGRDTVASLREEKRRYDKRNPQKKQGAEASIQGDTEYFEQAGVGGKHELIQSDDGHDKCLFLYMYTKKTHEEDVVDPKTGEPMRETVRDANGDPVPERDAKGFPIVDANGQPVYKTRTMRRYVTTVHVTKATRNCVIYEDVDTGLSRYPIAWGNWERQKNQYHGRALVTGIIPNQIFINTMFAMVMRHLQLMGFPKTVYNQDLIGQWDNEIGQAIGVRGMQPGQNIGQIATTLQPADMSNQIIYAIDKAMAYTKECLGATDVQMGAVKPDNTSALMVLQSNSEVPLENTRAGMYEWISDIGAVLLDMMGTYYGKRPLVRDKDFDEPVTGADGTPMIDQTTGQMITQKVTRRVAEEFDFSQFKHLWFNIRASVGATTYFSEIAMVQTLDNLRRDGTLDVIAYLERIPDKLIPKKQELIQELKRQALAAQQAPGAVAASAAAPVTMGSGAADAPGGPSMGGALDAEKTIQNMPQNIQQRFSALPQKAQTALLKVQGAE